MILFGFLSAFFGILLAEKPCPLDWEHIPQLDACFLSPTRPAEFDEAEEFCNSFEANLISVSTEEEARIVRDIFARENPSFFNWIGFRFNDEKGGFVWTNGSPVNFTHFLEGTLNSTGECVAWVLDDQDQIDGWQLISCQYSQFFMCTKPVEAGHTIWHTDEMGIIRSSGYPGKYENDQYETHVIKTKPGSRILLHFDIIDTEKQKDVITVTESYSIQGPALARLSGFRENVTMASNFEQLVINFESDDEVTSYGFSMTYKILHPLPLKIYTNSFGSIFSNNYPFSPSAHLIQDYLIQCTSDHHVEFQMKEFEIDSADRIKFHNGVNANFKKLQIFRRNTNINNVLKSTSTSTFFTYSTRDQQKSSNHWRLDYNCVHDGNLGDEIII